MARSLLRSRYKLYAVSYFEVLRKFYNNFRNGDAFRVGDLRKICRSAIIRGESAAKKRSIGIIGKNQNFVALPKKWDAILPGRGEPVMDMWPCDSTG
jgi:hypothetical protein